MLNKRLNNYLENMNLLCEEQTGFHSEDELQAALYAMYLYCKSWDLEVNPSRTKITIFSNRKFQHTYVFTYNNQVLDIDENFVYLGIMFSYNGRLLKNNQRLVEQARKAMFSILKKIS